MPTKQEISKEACARYGKARGDSPQAQFLVALNVAIMKGYSVPDAEAFALNNVRQTHPGFVPRPKALR